MGEGEGEDPPDLVQIWKAYIACSHTNCPCDSLGVPRHRFRMRHCETLRPCLNKFISSQAFVMIWDKYDFGAAGVDPGCLQ